MARIRSIKPEFWGDEKLSQLSFLSRLIYIGMWNFADDFGVIKGKNTWLKSQIFPYNNFEISEFDAALDELKNIKRILLFKVENEDYFYLPNFLKHQKIDKPSKVKNPAPTKEILKQCKRSTNNRRTLDEHSTKPRRALAVGTGTGTGSGSGKGTGAGTGEGARGGGSGDNGKSNALKNDIVALLKNRNVMPPASLSISENYAPVFVLQKIMEFDFLRLDNPDRLNKSPTGFLISSIKKNYDTPDGFYRWFEEKKDIWINSEKITQNIKNLMDEIQ